MIDLVGYGRPAREALGAAIATAKRGDALAPVTVIVPTNYAGLGLRRSLAPSMPLVNVRFQVAGRAAELLGGATLSAAGQKPLVPWIRMEAIRAALREDPGIFAGVASHPATARQLGRAFDDLRDVTPATLERLAGMGRRTADVIRLFRRTCQLTAGYYDESHLLEAAAAAVRAGHPGAREAGALILVLPRKVSGGMASLLEAAAAGPGAAAIIGLTGDARVDALARESAGRLARLGPVREGEPVSVPVADTVASLPDPEEEVRHAIRRALALARAGTPLHRMAILYQQPAQYALLAHEVLTSAGIPHNGPPVRRLNRTLAGRTVLGAYRVAASGFRREVVMDWLTSAPIAAGDGATAPSHRWDEISRGAGVVKGPDQWAARLEAWAARMETRAAANPEAAENNQRQAVHARELAHFVAQLAEAMGGEQRATAAAHARHAIDLLEQYLPLRLTERPGDEAAEAEAAAWEETRALLASIAGLEDELPPAMQAPVSRQEFANALEESLDVPAGRVGSLGDGIFVGPVAAAAEMEFEAVFVLGLVEGSASRGEDPIITESERERTDGEVASRRASLLQERRAYLAALAGSGTSTISSPRVDLRGQRPAIPSDWLLESASRLNGSAVYATGLGELAEMAERPKWLEAVHSFESALESGGERASLQERDLGSLLGARGAPERHFLAGEVEGLRDGMLARRSRARKRRFAGSGAVELDAWNGRVPPGAVAPAGSSSPVSPTALETFAECPFRYFLGHVLRVGEFERPEDTETISPGDAGTIMHAALQLFFEQTHPREDPLAPWTRRERALLIEIAEQQCAEAERRGITGKPLTWAAERARILRDLECFLDADEAERRATGFVYDRAEVAFGTNREGSPALPPVLYTLPDGTQVGFRGYIDRVDRGPGGALLVTDYKSGSSGRFTKAIDHPEPLARLDGGKRLQLPVYALALEEEARGAPISARYWFITEREGYKQARLPLDTGTREAFGEVVQVLADTMRAGFFPAVPGEEERNSYRHCQYCPYDRVCPPGQRLEMWKQFKDGPVVAKFAGLSGGILPTGEPADA